MTTPKSIVWLHLSDLHLCEPKTGWDAHRVLKPLIEDLKAMEQTHGLLPQLLFFTGDGAFGNYGSGKGSTLAEQFVELEALLAGVRTAFSQEIPKNHTFLVPGNHDVDRAEVTDSDTHWIETQATTDKVTGLIKEKPKQWRSFMDRLTAYRTFLEQNGYDHLLEDPDRLIYSQVRQINDIKLGIGGFNSAWNCSRDKEKSKLWLGTDWQDGTIVDHLDKLGTDLRIALIHHPPGWFVEQEDGLIRRNMEKNFNFFLHGHEHDGWVNTINNRHVRIAAAACYEKSDQENGYNFVRLNLETGDIEIWLRRFDGHGGGWIPRVVAGKKTNNDGLWVIKALPCLAECKQSNKFTGQSNGLFVQSPEYSEESASTYSLFLGKVRGQIKRIFSTNTSAIIAVREELLKDQAVDIKSEEILIPANNAIELENAIRLWRKTIKSCLESRKDLAQGIRQCANDVLGWLVLLVIKEAELKKHSGQAYDFSNTSEIIVPITTPAGTGIFVARLFEKPARLQLTGNSVHCSGWIDPGKLERGLFPDDRLKDIEREIYQQVMFDLPPSTGDWLSELKHTLRLRYEDDQEVYYFTIAKVDYSDDLNIVGQLKTDLPHLKAIIIGSDQMTGNSLLVMDESLLVPLLREFLLMLENFA